MPLTPAEPQSAQPPPHYTGLKAEFNTLATSFDHKIDTNRS